MEEELGFVARVDHSGFDQDMKHIEQGIDSAAKKIEKSGMSVDEFAKRMQGVLASFDKLTQAVDKNTKAQEKVAEAGKKAADAEKQGADKATDAINKTGSATRELGRDLKKTGDEGSEGFGKLQKAAAGFFTLAAAKEFAGKVFEVRSEIESLETSFRVLIGDKDKADALFNSIREFATKTPMQMKDLASAAQTMMGFGLPVEQLMQNLKALGDVSMGDAQKFQSLALAFSQASAAGKLTGQDLMQMINAGFNPLKQISETTGKSIGQLKEEMEKGAISTDMLRQAFIDATSEGGQFYGMLEAKSAALEGAYSNLQGAITDMFNEIGQQSEGVMRGAIDVATLLAKNYETVGKVLMGIVAAYGTYKAAVMAVTAIQSLQAAGVGALTAAETIHYGWLVLCEKAQALLNKTMLANPYVLAATAIAGVTAAIWAFTSSTDEASESQQRLNDTVNDYKSKAVAEQAEIDRLFDKLRNAKEGTREYKDVKDQIISQYGKYLSGLNSEIATLKNVEGAYKAVTKAAREASLARGKEAALKSVQDTYGQSYSDNISKLQNALNKKAGGKQATAALTQIQNELRKTGTISAETEKKVKSLLVGSADYGNAGAWITGLRTGEKNLKDYTKLVEERFKLDEEEESHQEKKNVRNKKAIEEDKKKTQAELDALSVTEAVGKKGAALRKKIAGYDKELEAYSTKADTKAASAAAKAAAKAERDRQHEANEDATRRQRLFDLTQKELEREAREKADLEDANADLLIASEQDANKREQLQREKSHKDTLDQINRQVEEWKKANYEAAKEKWEAENKDKSKTFSDTEAGKAGWQGQQLNETQEATRIAMLQRETAEYNRASQDRAKALISAHQSYTDKKIQLDREYSETVRQINQAIYEAEVRGEKETVEALKRTKRQAATDNAKNQSALSLDALKESPDYIRAFEDLQKTSESTLEYLIEEFEKAKDAAANSLDPKDLKEYTDTIQRMKDELNSRDPFRAMTESIKKLDAAQKNTRAAKERLDLVKKGINVTKSLRKEGDKIVSVYYTQAEAEKELRKAEDEEREVQIEVLEQKKAAQDAIMKLGDSIANLGNTMGGTAGEILNLIGSVVSTTVSAIQSVEGIAMAGTAAMKAVESASVILAIVGAALQLFTALFSLLGNGDNYAEAKAQYDNLVEVWDELIDKKKEYLSQSWGKEVEGAKQEALQMLRTMRAETKIIANEVLGSGSSYGSHSIGYRMWEGSYKYDGKNWKDVAGDIERELAAAGLGSVSFTGMESLINMSAEQLTWIKENYTGFWAMMDTDFKDYLDKLIEYGDEEKQILEQAREQVTGTSFDSVFDDMMDSLLDLADGSEDAMEDIAENWQKMINKMFVQNLIGEDVKKQLREWYDAVAQLQENYNSGRITENSYMVDLEDLKNKYNTIVSDSQQKIAQYTEMGIIKPIEEATSEMKEYFEGLSDSWLDTLTDMEASAEDFEKEIARVMTEDLIKSLVLDAGFENWLKDWKERYTAAIEAGDTEAMNALREEQMKRREELAEEAKQYADATGYTELARKAESEVKDMFDSLHNSLLDALMDVNTDAAEWGRNIAQTIARQIVEEQLLNSAFDGVLDEWKKSVTAIIAEGSITDAATIEAVRQKTGEMQDTLAALAPEVQEFLKAIGAVEGEVDKITTSFANLGSTVSSSLSDISKTSEDFFKSISETMTAEMIESIINTRYAEQMKDIADRWQAALKAGDTSVMQEIRDELVALREAAGESVQPLIDDLKEIKAQADTSFTGMKGSWLSSLSDMSATTKDFAENIRKTVAQKMIEAFVLGDSFDKWLSDFQGKYNSVMSDTEKTAEQKQREVKAMLDVWVDEYEQLRPLATQIMEAFGLENTKADSVFSNLRDSLRSVLSDMSKDATDFAKDISKTMAEAMIDKYVLGSQYDEWFEAWQKKYDGLIGDDMTEEDRQAALNKLIKEAKEYAESLDAEAQRWLTAFGQNNAEDQSATMNMAEAATYDQFEMYLGIAMAQQMCQEQQKGIQQQILATLQGMGGITDPSSTTLTEMRNMMMTGNEYLLDIKRSNREILTQFGARLEQINNNLNRL